MNELPAGQWLNPPSAFEVTDDCIAFSTEPRTDLWQRTYYGFQNINAPAYLWETDHNVSFTCSVRFNYRELFDQAGVLVWVDESNWIKASVEYDNGEFSRLGVVVTNRGYSDWSTRNCESIGFIQFRIAQRGPDFLIEANEGGEWEQLRMCHLGILGETTTAMAAVPAREMPAVPVSVGVYACSPGESSFEVEFDQIHFQASEWAPHMNN